MRGDIGDLLSELLDGDVEGMDDAEIGEAVRTAVDKRGMRGERRVVVNNGIGKARGLECPLSRAAALAAAASTNMTGTPTRDALVARMVMFSSAHDDVSITSILVAGRPQNIGAASAPCPIVRFYRDTVDTLPISWDPIPATQDVVITVKNEHAATATNIMGTLDLETVS